MLLGILRVMFFEGLVLVEPGLRGAREGELLVAPGTRRFSDVFIVAVLSRRISMGSSEVVSPCNDNMVGKRRCFRFRSWIATLSAADICF